MPKWNIRRVAFVAVGLSAVAVFVSVIGLLEPSLQIGLGDVPTWVQALTTIVTAVFAIVAASIARDLYKVEMSRDQQIAEERRERVADQRRTQAAKFCAWYGWHQDPHATFGNRDIMQYGAYIRNASDLPIYNVKTYFIDPREVADPDRRLPFYFEHVPVVPPGTEPIFLALDRRIVEEVFADQEDRQQVLVAIEFRDAANIRWRRDTTGHLMSPAADTSHAPL